ncbi:MAG: amidohydrolase family protein [Chloroflexi bacterium]|nr:amidohydrolase family protein [Chloroflexota bacterium]
MILDCHLHYWRYPEHFPKDVFAQFTGARQQGQTEEQIKERADRQADKLLREMKEAGVEKGVVLGLKSGTTLGIEVNNEDIAKALKPHAGKLYWGPGVILTDSGAADEVEHCIRDLEAVAVGEIGPGYGYFRIDDPRCFPVYEVARSYDVPISIHAGPVGPRNTYLKYGDLLALDEVCVNFPTLKVVLCHMGEPHYHEAAHLMSKHANLYADISMVPRAAGLSAMAPPPVVYPFPHLDEPLLYYFSAPARNRNKLLWASDVQNPKESMEGIRGVNGRLKKMGYPTIPEELIENMFHENWKQVFTKIQAK